MYLKKYSKKFLDYFPPKKNGMIESVSTQRIFHTSVVHSKPSIEKRSICYEVPDIKSRDQINNQFLINCNSCFTEMYPKKTITTSNMKPFQILVGAFQLITYVSKNSISVVSEVQIK